MSVQSESPTPCWRSVVVGVVVVVVVVVARPRQEKDR